MHPPHLHPRPPETAAAACQPLSSAAPQTQASMLTGGRLRLAGPLADPFGQAAP